MDVEEVREEVRNAIECGVAKDRIRELLAKYKAKSVSELPPASYIEFVVKLKTTL